MKKTGIAITSALLIGEAASAALISQTFVGADLTWIGTSVGTLNIDSEGVVADGNISNAANFAVTGTTPVNFGVLYDAGLMDTLGIEATDGVISMTAIGLGITGGGSGGLGKNVPEGYTVSFDFSAAGATDTLTVTKINIGSGLTGTVAVSDLNGHVAIFNTADANDWVDISSLGLTITGPQTTALFSMWNNNTGNQQYRLGGVEVSVIPEPATLGLVAVIGSGLLAVRRMFLMG